MTQMITDLLKQSCFSTVPFHPVPRDDSLIWAGSKETRDKLTRIITEVRHGSIELSHFALIYGEYGSGKTHALKYLKAQLQASNVISAYLVSPKVEKKASFHGVVKEVIKQIGERPLRTAVEPFVAFIREEAKRLAIDDLSAGRIEGSLDQYVKKREPDFKRNLQEEIYAPFPELLGLFEGLVSGDANVWRYFTGKPTAAALAPYGLSSPMEDDHDALRTLAGIYQVLTNKYPQIPNTPIYDAAYLFIDEMENLLEIKTDEVISLRTGIRDIFNACTQHFCIILAATAENAALFHALLDEALMVRITAEPVHIESHDAVEDGSSFIRDLMDNYRSAPPATPFHPFTEEGLAALVERTGRPRTARRLITNCRRAWEQNAALVVSGGTIGPDEVNEVIGFL